MIYDCCRDARAANLTGSQNTAKSVEAFENIMNIPELYKMPGWNPIPTYNNHLNIEGLIQTIFFGADKAGIGGEDMGIYLIERYLCVNHVRAIPPNPAVPIARAMPAPALGQDGRIMADKTHGVVAGRGLGERYNQQEAKIMEQDDLARRYEDIRNRQPRMQHLFTTNGPKASGKLYKIEPMNTQLRSDMEMYIQGAFVLDHTYIELLYGRVNLGMSRYDYDYFWESPWYVFGSSILYYAAPRVDVVGQDGGASVGQQQEASYRGAAARVLCEAVHPQQDVGGQPGCSGGTVETTFVCLQEIKNDLTKLWSGLYRR
jgi:hypothetical protein